MLKKTGKINQEIPRRTIKEARKKSLKSPWMKSRRNPMKNPVQVPGARSGTIYERILEVTLGEISSGMLEEFP